MAVPTISTRLSAVNTILRCINEAPVDTLTPPPTDDVQMALDVLDETTVETMSKGWSFNTEADIELTLDIDGKYAIPADVIRIVLDKPRSTLALTMRDDAGTLRLYNKAKNQHTFVLPVGLKATLIRLVDFEATPEVFRRYVTIRSARAFQARLQGASASSYSERDEMVAMSHLRADEGQVEPRTMFDSWAAYRVIDRRYPNIHGQGGWGSVT